VSGFGEIVGSDDEIPDNAGWRYPVAGQSVFATLFRACFQVSTQAEASNEQVKELTEQLEQQREAVVLAQQRADDLQVWLMFHHVFAVVPFLTHERVSVHNRHSYS
jgi:hypothetical protein